MLFCRKALADPQSKCNCSSRELFCRILSNTNIYFSLFSRFDVEKECERIDGNMIKQSPANINTGHPKIKTQVDASCNVLYSISCSVFRHCKAFCAVQSVCVCKCVCKICGLLHYIQCWHKRRSSSWQIVKRTKAMKLLNQKITRRQLHTIPGQSN